jgi:hypothetical protein
MWERYESVQCSSPATAQAAKGEPNPKSVGIRPALKNFMGLRDDVKIGVTLYFAPLVLTYMWVSDKLWNGWTRVSRHYFQWRHGYDVGMLSYGSRIYLTDDWPGYDCCADKRCTHYRCEHDLHFGPAIYIAPHIDPATVPDRWDIEGCANADCPCERFQERELANSKVWKTKLLTFLRPKRNSI